MQDSQTGNAGHLVLVADDVSSTRALLRGLLEKRGFRVLEAADGEQVMQRISHEVSLICLDLQMPKTSGMDCIAPLRKEYPEIPIVIISSAGMDSAVRAMKKGAFWFLQKPIAEDSLLSVVDEALSESSGFSRDLPWQLLGESAAITQVRESLAQTSSARAPLLLSGETGSGRSAILTYILHQQGEQRPPLATIHALHATAAQFDEREADSESHTSLFSAPGGIVCLDGIERLSPALQATLRKALDSDSWKTQNTRLISLSELSFTELSDGAFLLDDLLAAIAENTLFIPPLRQRIEDLLQLAPAILERISKRRGTAAVAIAPEAMQALRTYSWPGNCVELEALLEEASAFASGERITLADLVFDESRSLRDSAEQAIVLGGVPLEEIEKRAIAETLRLCNNNKAEASRRLKISERSIYNKIKRFDL